MKKGIRYLLIAFLLCGCINDDNLSETYPVPNGFMAKVFNINQNITHEYLSVYSVGKNDSKLFRTSRQYYLNTDTSIFLIPPDFNTDSIYLCFENVNTQIDTVGLCYKRKLYAQRSGNKSIDFEIRDSKIFYLSSRFNKDSSIIINDARSRQNDGTYIRLYKN